MCLEYEKMGGLLFFNFKSLWEVFLFFFFFKCIVIPTKNKNNTAALWFSFENKKKKNLNFITVHCNENFNLFKAVCVSINPQL